VSAPFLKSLFALKLTLKSAIMDREHAGEMTFEVDAGHDEPNSNNVTSSQERKLLMKVDLCVLPTVIVLYLLCFIDRTNIGKAILRMACLYPRTDRNRQRPYSWHGGGSQPGGI